MITIKFNKTSVYRNNKKKLFTFNLRVADLKDEEVTEARAHTRTHTNLLNRDRTCYYYYAF